MSNCLVDPGCRNDPEIHERIKCSGSKTPQLLGMGPRPHSVWVKDAASVPEDITLLSDRAIWSRSSDGESLNRMTSVLTSSGKDDAQYSVDMQRC